MINKLKEGGCMFGKTVLAPINPPEELLFSLICHCPVTHLSDRPKPIMSGTTNQDSSESAGITFCQAYSFCLGALKFWNVY